MGYYVHIKRDKRVAKISAKDWRNLIGRDSQFELIDTFYSKLENGDALSVSTPNAGLWKKKILFTFNPMEGSISVKNPNQSVIMKMVEISKSLDSMVIGEEGETYDEYYMEYEISKDELLKISQKLKIKPFDFKVKKWWQFWK